MSTPFLVKIREFNIGRWIKVMIVKSSIYVANKIFLWLNPNDKPITEEEIIKDSAENFRKEQEELIKEVNKVMRGGIIKPKRNLRGKNRQLSDYGKFIDPKTGKEIKPII